VEALLVLDLSKEYAAYLQTFNSPLMKVIRFMQWFLVLSSLLLIFLAYRYYKTRRELTKDLLTLAYTKFYLNEFFYTHKVDAYDFILMDIDDFKLINQKHTRQIGDEVLLSFVDHMHRYLPKKSKIIRFGGSDFLAVIPKDTIKDIKIFSENFYLSLSNVSYFASGKEISLNVSMTAIDTPSKVNKLEDILRLLDGSLLKIKQTGKNRLEILEDISVEQVRYRSMDYIKEALEDERFTCVYQPIFRSNTKEVVKHEALVRMVDREDATKLVSPYYFLDVLRGTREYIALSKFVLSHVFNTLGEYPSIELSMNLDLDDLDNEDMMQLIHRYLSDYREKASRLTFEIVEENEIYDYEKVNNIFEQLRRYGSKIAIDDFGSGYANYTYLSRLDVDIIKLDANFIHDLETRPKEAKIVIDSILSLASKLDCQVIAEFVHSEEIYMILKEIGVEFVQGYYLGKPKALKEYLLEI